LIPGISRSGSTLFGLKFTNLDTESSFKYSYLLFIPITFCSFLLEIIKLITNEINLLYPLYYYFLGITISLITTFTSIKLLSLIIKKDKLYIFSYYLLILSLFCIILLK
jgi:undecaprenyl-diphosphatase